VSIRNDLWITADARIDGREELIEKLKSELTPQQSPSDAELILYAYQVWGDDCVKHLIGDFAFAVWDSRLQRLFCARDHFGVKPFFFAHLPDDLILSATINCLRQDPRVSETLNEVAVGDYLLFGVNQDLSTTIFKDIQRLPPAHCLSVANGTLKTWRYWTPDISTELRFRDPQSYVERFRELLSCAVADRLRTDRVAVSMSGGLDSTSLTAIARKQLKDDAALKAFTVVYDNLIPDQERHYSTLAAEHLGISITHVNADRYTLFDEQVPGDMDQPEPFLLSPLTGQFNDLLRLCAGHASIALTGYDGDAFMTEPQKSRFKLRSKLKRIFRRYPPAHLLPAWVNESFARRTMLRDRWKQSLTNPDDPIQRRPSAMRALNSKGWAALFEGYAPAATKLQLEVRHPFIDLRLVEYLLSIPAVPWCVNKHILRVAMKDMLPAAILERPKTALAGDPALQLVHCGSVRWLDSFEVSPPLNDFVDLDRRRSVADEETSEALWASLRVFALNYWLTNSARIDRKRIANSGSQSRHIHDLISLDRLKLETTHGIEIKNSRTR
jgi:asparagine synthase (glutamine-hydrolysing)